MKLCLIVLLTFSITSAFPQNGQVIETNDNCVISKFIHFRGLDSSHLRIQKVPIPDLLARISCHNSYHYPARFTDQEFELTVPRYLNRTSFQFGDNEFGIRFDDTSYLKGTIVIEYDFDGHYKPFFLQHINDPEREATKKLIDGRQLWIFRNWDDQYAGRIFLSDNVYISYYTKAVSLLPELQKALVSFKWE
jgi:hypothetical protein